MKDIGVNFMQNTCSLEFVRNEVWNLPEKRWCRPEV